MKTEEGREVALGALAQRRATNRLKPRVDNDRLPAYAPMFFYCIGCGQELVVPESYTRRAQLCPECQALKELGWME